MFQAGQPVGTVPLATVEVAVVVPVPLVPLLICDGVLVATEVEVVPEPLVKTVTPVLGRLDDETDEPEAALMLGTPNILLEPELVELRVAL